MSPGGTFVWVTATCTALLASTGLTTIVAVVRWLLEDYGLDARGAHLILGQCARYDLGNVYDPAYTMVCKVSKRHLASAPRVGRAEHG